MSGYLQNHLDTHEIPEMKLYLKNRRFREKGAVGNNTITYKCDICPHAYINEDGVVTHRRVSHKRKMKKIQMDPNSCKICIIRFESQEELFQHTKAFHLLSSVDATQIEHEIFVCEYCKVIFLNKQLLIFHMELEHKERFKCRLFKRYKSPICSKHVKGLRCLCTFHELQSTSCCPICFDKCKDSDDLVCKHSKKHEKQFVCSSCGWVSTMLSDHEVHCMKHVKEDIYLKIEDANYKHYFIYSQRVNKRYMQFFRRRLYLGCAHGVMLPVGMGVCVVCRYIATSVDDMKKHVSVDHGPFIKKKKQVHQCMECDEEFCNAVLLKQHRLKGCKPTVTYWGQINS